MPRTNEATRVRDRFERLLAAGLAIHAKHSLDDVLQEVVNAARDVVGARYAALGVLGPDRTTLVQFVTSGLDDETRRRIGSLPTGRGLLGHVIAEAKPIRSADINHHPLRFGFPAHHPAMKSFLGVPVRGRAGVFGNLYLTEKTGGDEFDAEDEAIAVLLAAQAAGAVESAQLLDQVHAMQRQRDLFFAMMNHELRNALTGVYGWAERLVRKKSPEATAHAAQEVFEGAERTITLLNNFLDLTRLDSGRVKPVWREVDLVPALGSAVSGVEPVAEGKRIRLEVVCAGAPATVRTDPVRFNQILVNLLANAIRHGPEGQPVTIHAEDVTPILQVRVVDRGPGVPVDLRERIFEPFERFDPNSGAGTGLGLPVSRRLAEVLGGRLTVEDTPGGGATFVLSLPMKVSSDDL
ncbi:MAG TPA: GAF domain-containing sensor histidine kinase [Gemmatimonadales bacterium]|jgi:signal transduction histidine kinase|nr:GAF domain-containing sensor histidine kinase [Gemmatimonadales bacterium]